MKYDVYMSRKYITYAWASVDARDVEHAKRLARKAVDNYDVDWCDDRAIGRIKFTEIKPATVDKE